MACVGFNKQRKIDNAPNDLNLVEHIISNDEFRYLTPRLGWIDYALNCIIYTFTNEQL